MVIAVTGRLKSVASAQMEVIYVTTTKNVVMAPAVIRICARIVTARLVFVKARASRKCAKNATVMATAYRNAEKVRNAATANAAGHARNVSKASSENTVSLAKLLEKPAATATAVTRLSANPVSMANVKSVTVIRTKNVAVANANQNVIIPITACVVRVKTFTVLNVVQCLEILLIQRSTPEIQFLGAREDAMVNVSSAPPCIVTQLGPVLAIGIISRI
jgi:hypothetical protein